MLDHTDQPTKAEVEEMLTDFEAHELLSSRKDVYEFVGRVFKAYLAQDEELKELRWEYNDLLRLGNLQEEISRDAIAAMEKLEAENLAQGGELAAECIRYGKLAQLYRQQGEDMVDVLKQRDQLKAENLALKSSSYRVDQQDGE